MIASALGAARRLMVMTVGIKSRCRRRRTFLTIADNGKEWQA